MKSLMGIALLFLVTASCAGPSEAYVAADLATYEVVAPAHKAYVEADPLLDADQKNRRLLLLQSWELRVRHGGAK